MFQDDAQLLEDIFLLAMLNKEANEKVDDIIEILADTKALSVEEGKEIASNLRAKGAIVGEGLSFLGISLANEAKEKFKLN